jgi:hypothetical protein
MLTFTAQSVARQQQVHGPGMKLGSSGSVTQTNDFGIFAGLLKLREFIIRALSSLD